MHLLTVNHPTACHALTGAKVAVCLPASRIPKLHKRKVSFDLSIAHEEEAGDDDNPVQIIRDDGAEGGRILPAKNGVEDAPSTAAIQLWISELNQVRDLRP